MACDYESRGLFGDGERMTDLICPNCGSDRRAIHSGSRCNKYRTDGVKGHIQNNKYMCLRCGSIYSKGYDGRPSYLVAGGE